MTVHAGVFTTMGDLHESLNHGTQDDTMVLIRRSTLARLVATAKLTLLPEQLTLRSVRDTNGNPG